VALYYYFEPQVKNVSVIRCNSSGKADDGGTYLKISATRNYCETYQTSQVATEVIRNYCLIRYRYRMLPSGSYSSWVTILAKTASSDSVTTGALLGNLSADESYEVIVGVLDDAGSEANTSIVISSKGVFMHRDGEQNSLSIGEVVTEKNTVTIAEKLTTFIKGLLKTKNIQSEGTVSASGGFATGSATFTSTSVDMHEEGYYGDFSVNLPKEQWDRAGVSFGHPHGGGIDAYCSAGEAAGAPGFIRLEMWNRYAPTRLRLGLLLERALLTGLTAPVDASDATNKEYVDAGLADKYSPTNKPTPDAIGAMSMDLLWENASKSSSFAGQKISVSVNAYDYLMIVAGYNTGENNGSTVTFIRMRPYGVGETSYCITVDYFTSSNTLTRPYRKLTIPSGRGSITFGDGYKQDGTASNSNVIPYYIYGVKGVTN
jgi:hypothetical protein